MNKILLVLTILNVLFFSFGMDVPQRNPEYLFLTDEGRQDLQNLKQDFGDSSPIFASNLSDEKFFELSEMIDSKGGEFSPLKPLIPKTAILKLPEMDDAKKFHFFSSLIKDFPEVTFAGEEYTNAHLAGMSIKIQKILFPIVFSLIFIGLILLTGNLFSSLYLFFSSLLGVGIGSSTIKILYGHTTILTTLTPLIGFILTLGVQLHLVYGIQYYKSRKVFLDKKFKPLMIMMITTLIGFLGLVSSDLEGIRQLAIGTTLSLGITWGILLMIIILFPTSFKVKVLSFKTATFKFPESITFRNLAFVLLTFLILGGFYGIKKMPLLVEAIHFFPENHPVTIGYNQILKDLGGTPQFELVIKKKDHSELNFEDFLRMASFEEFLDKKFPNKKIISLNNIIKRINSEYAGTSTLPDNSYAYEMLSSKIPELLKRNQLSESSYKISFISPILTNEERDHLKKDILETFGHLDSLFSVRISGLTYLILESQSQLVKSLVKSFFVSFIIIVCIYSFFSKNFKDIVVFGIINFASILGGIMAMWLCGMSLNVSSIMTVSISMGLAVDSTVHLIHAKKEGESSDVVYQTTLIPIIFSHILLFFSFLILSFEVFIPIRDFSLGLVILLFVGLICDLYVLPLLSVKRG